MTDPERELIELGRRALTPSPQQRAALLARIDRAATLGPPPSPYLWPLRRLGLAVALGLAGILWSARAPEVEAPAPDESAESAAAPPIADAVDASVVDAGLVEVDAGSVESTAHQRPRSRAACADTLDRELQILGVARRALGRGDGLASLVYLEEHARSFPDGALAEERDALVVRAHCAAGHEREARHELALFTARYPGSVSLPTLRASCAGSAPSP